MSNFQPDTPQLFDQNGDNVNSGLLQQALDQLATFESDLANIRKEKHSKWLSDISRKERCHSSTKEGQELMEQTVIDSELLTRMVQNTNNLLESLDFNPISTGLFCLVVALGGGGGGVFHPPSITPLSLKLDCSNFVRRYFQIG